MIMRINSRIAMRIALLLSLFYGMPFVGTLPHIIRYAILALVVVFSLIGIIISSIQKNTNGVIVLCLSLCLLFFLYIGFWSRSARVINYIGVTINFWLYLSISVSLDDLDLFDNRLILRVFLAVFSFTLLTTAIGCIRYPEASRILATGIQSQNSMAYKRSNIGGYETIYSAVLLIPVVVHLVETRKNKVLYIVLLFLIIVNIVLSQYTIALLLGFSILFISIIISRPSLKKRNILGALIVLGAVLYLSTHIVTLLQELVTFLQDNEYKQSAIRISELLRIIQYKQWGVDSGSRIMLYEKSWNTFKQSPLFGCMFEKQGIGGHSEILDTLAATGVFGASFAALVFYIVTKSVMKTITKEMKSLIAVSFLSLLLLMCINTAFTSPLIAFVVFCLPIIVCKTENN